jgi:gliding motility-associated-like protein
MKKNFIILFYLMCSFCYSQQSLELCEGESKTFTYYSQSNSIGSNTWYVNGIPYNTEELTYTFSEGGSYNIILRRENGPCYAEQSFQIIVTECPGIIYYVPNSFTPDSDEHNQLFGPVMTEGFDIDGFSFIVFNRWGEIVWESQDPLGRWDGTYNGKKCQDGVYSWGIQFSVFGNDEKIQNFGHVILIK